MMYDHFHLCDEQHGDGGGVGRGGGAGELGAGGCVWADGGVGGGGVGHVTKQGQY